MFEPEEGEVKVRWHCYASVGAPYWHEGFDWHYECDECDTEFETVESLDDWNEGSCMAKCPECGYELSQYNDEGELVE